MSDDSERAARVIRRDNERLQWREALEEERRAVREGRPLVGPHYIGGRHETRRGGRSRDRSNPRSQAPSETSTSEAAPSMTTPTVRSVAVVTRGRGLARTFVPPLRRPAGLEFEIEAMEAETHHVRLTVGEETRLGRAIDQEIEASRRPAVEAPDSFEECWD